MTLATRIEGPADGPALVLLHAIATSGALWAPQAAVLAARFRVVRIDLPGHGDSPPAGAEPDYAGYADAVADTLTAHGITRFALAGLSFGAMVAMQVAVRHGPRVAGVVLACCAAQTPAPVETMWRTRIAAVRDGGMAGQIEPTLARWFTPEFAAASPLTLAWVRDMILATPPAGFIAAAGMIAALDHRDLLPRIACPALVLAGAHDQAAPPAGMAAIAALIPAARLITLPAAHLANIEAATAFTEAIGGFAASL